MIDGNGDDFATSYTLWIMIKEETEWLPPA